MNCQKRVVDVWLIYRCVECAATWNRTVHSRRTPEQIDGEAYQRYLRNDPETARAVALADDPTLTKVSGGGSESFRVRKPSDAPPTKPGDRLRITLVLSGPCPMRLDRVLSLGLGLSREAVRAAVQRGRLSLGGDDPKALRRPPRDGQVILWQADEG